MLQYAIMRYEVVTPNATSWSTILYAHDISATTQQIIAKFSAVATYVKMKAKLKVSVHHTTNTRESREVKKQLNFA